ncbi:MAG: nucleotidyltransferase family protein [Deltaproteobacteria bacterium]|nr:nucleotidyltransferase family protein [Deltaproteobacteria bacterium]
MKATDPAQALLSAWLPAALSPECPPPLEDLLLGSGDCADSPNNEEERWRSAFPRAHAQGVAPLLWASLERWNLSGVLARRASPFAAAHSATLRQNVLHLAELSRITGVLAARRIVPILLKGAAFLDDLYPHPALRPMADLDLLIPFDDVARARQALEALGYRGLRPGLADALLETNHEIELARRLPDGTRMYVELHWRLLPKTSLVAGPAVEPDALWTRTRPCSDTSIAARVLAPEDAFLFSALHLQRHAYSRAVWFVDLALLMNKHELDWQRVVRQADAFGARGALHAALAGTAALCGVHPPRQIERALRPGPVRARAVSAILRWTEMFGASAIRGEHALPPSRRYLLKLIQARDTLAALGRIAEMIHPSEAWLRARYGLRGHRLPAGIRRRHLAAAWRAMLGLAGAASVAKPPGAIPETATTD